MERRGARNHRLSKGMRTPSGIAADNLALWRENAAQTQELRRIQALLQGRAALTRNDVEKTVSALWPRKGASDALERADEIEEQISFVQGLLQAHAHEALLQALPLPTLSPAPTAPRVVFLESVFGREALKQFDPLLSHPLPVTAPSFTAVCEELVGDRADFALLPLEDSHEGRFLHLYEEIDRFELHITHSCTVTTEDGRSVLMGLLSHRYIPQAAATGERLLSCAVLEESSHTLCDLLTAARACSLTLRRVDTLPTSYGEDVVIYHPLLAAKSEQDELAFLLYLTLFQPRARATARYLHLKG